MIEKCISRKLLLYYLKLECRGDLPVSFEYKEIKSIDDWFLYNVYKNAVENFIFSRDFITKY